MTRFYLFMTVTGDWVSKQIPDKTFKLLSGGCPTHARIRCRGY